MMDVDDNHSKDDHQTHADQPTDDNQNQADQPTDDHQSQSEDDLTDQTDDEYAQQYFGFLPQHFLNGVYNLICEYLEEAITAVNTAVLNKFKSKLSEAEQQKVESGKQELVLQAVKRLDEKFDSAENYLLNNVFKIPDHVVLPEDKVQIEKCCTEAEMVQLDGDIQTVIEKIVAVTRANGQLEKRLTEIDQLQGDFDKTLDNMKNIQTKVHNEANSTLQTVSDVGKIQELITKLELELK